MNIVKLAIEAPLKQIALNAGHEPGVVVERVRGLAVGHGLNAATGEYGDMLGQGIADPVKVTRSALLNAASIAGTVPHHRSCCRREARAPGSGSSRPRRRNGLLGRFQTGARLVSRAPVLYHQEIGNQTAGNVASATAPLSGWGLRRALPPLASAS